MHLRRSGARFTAGLLLALLLAGLFANPGRATAQRDNGITSDTSYESPEFGYEIEWDDPWVAEESDTESSADGDSLTLVSDGAYISILGFAYTGDPVDAVEVIIESLGENTDDLEILDESGDDELATAEVVFNVDGTDASEYIEARPVGRNASIVVTLTSPTAFYDDELESAAGAIELDGDPIFSGLDNGSSSRADNDDDGTRSRGDEDEDDSDGRNRQLADDDDEDEEKEDFSRTSRNDDDDEDRDDSRHTSDDEDDDRRGRSASGVDGSSYVSPTYGYSLDWDRDWEFIEDSEMISDGRIEMDQVGIFNGASAVFVAGRQDYDGHAASCVEGEADALAATDGIDEVEILTGDDGEPLGLDGDEFAFGLYSLISTGGDGPIIQIVYVECRTVIANEAVVSLVGTMPLDAFEAEFESILALSGALVVDAG